MDNVFDNIEQLYRAVFPQSEYSFLWKKDGTISDAALRDKNGLSVERGYYRSDKEVVDDMSRFFTGTIFALTVEDCRKEGAVVIYKPTERSAFHSEIHGSREKALLTGSQRKHLIQRIRVVKEI